MSEVGTHRSSGCNTVWTGKQPFSVESGCCPVQSPRSSSSCTNLYPEVEHVVGLQPGRSRVRFPTVSLGFLIDIILLAALWPWGLQPLTEKSTKSTSWWGKGSRCVGLTNLLPSCADCLEMWESQLPGALRACPGL